MKTITLDNCEYELTDERFESLLTSKAITKIPDLGNGEDPVYALDCWHGYTYDEVCMIIKGPE